ncbi:MAG: CRISPR-associated endonuclease Cas1 [Spirochaetes bacterium GWF1_49_6]|nr:MAG: CRISPR-associated endonuclease Cas1 [Spirochaetes bacterium GWF1_49_6]
MLLFLTTYGSYLHTSDGLITVEIGKDKAVKQISPKKVESIFISTGAALSTDLIQLCYDNNIDIVFMDKYGNPTSRVWHSKLGSTALIRKKQIEASVGETGAKYAKLFISRKFENQKEWMERLIKTRPHHAAIIGKMIETLADARKKLDETAGAIEDIRETLLGIEGSAGRAYFRTISALLPDAFQFEERSRNPAKDEFNAILNYMYGILYGVVEKACILAGIDPFVGIMHTDNYNKKSFVFDAMEMVRIYADESAVYLFSNRKLGKTQFQTIENGVLIGDEAKKIVIEHFISFLDESIRYRGRNISRRHTVLLELRHLANEWLEGEAKIIDKIDIEEL